MIILGTFFAILVYLETFHWNHKELGYTIENPLALEFFLKIPLAVDFFIGIPLALECFNWNSTVNGIISLPVFFPIGMSVEFQ